jgi:2-methylcitrate dehydratase PrpD
VNTNMAESHPSVVLPLTRMYAGFAAEMAGRTLPEAVRRVAILGFTDALGVMLAGAREPAVARLSDWVVEQGGAPRCWLVSRADRTHASQSALVNATAAHALDYDDFAFSNHPSAVLVPAILAAAETVGANGARMLRAYAAGYEVWADAFLREPDLYYDKGWHPTAVLGPLGAAVAAGVVWGLSAAQMSDALALAASSAGGVFENFGTMAKPWHGGRAASVGVQAAGLARAGLAASPSAIEGGRGLLKALSPAGRVDLSTAMPAGWRSEKLGLNIKKYPLVGAAQRGIDAALALRSAQAPDPDRITSIVAHVSVRHAAVMPYALPQDSLQAKFSLPFAVSAALVHGAVGFSELQDEVVLSPVMQRLMACTQLVTTEAFEPGWRDAAPFDQIFVHLSDGRVLESPQVRRAAGHADTPLSPSAILDKFLGCTRHAGVADDRALALYEQLQNLDQVDHVGALCLPVVGPARAA